jgi:hypothetical protein
MAVFLGHQGNIRLKRATESPDELLSSQVSSDDVNTSLNLISFDGAAENLITGDRVVIATEDVRGLVCFGTGAWLSGTIQSGISAFVSVNLIGGLRFFNSFADAINNNRAAELPVATFAGAPIAITVQVEAAASMILGNVVSYTFNTDREAIDCTSLSDKFKKQYSAGLISGGGSIDCLFDYRTSGAKDMPLLMLQLVQRVDIGSEFDLALYLTEKSTNPGVENIYYELSAMVTRAGVTVEDSATIACTIDFVTTGEIKLLIGDPADYVLKEDDDRISLEQSLDFLLQ